ncbi:hypothetical protein [Phaeobacter inhibens]|uniref:hypothetical protein n=1 Tax=Phaeobacter inhibens TaxID=221822 RepID=UPI00295EFDBD|nr:hypothetical protein [Phaeobacter inhibens]
MHRAAQALRNLGRDPYADIYTRSFDTCFEMYDGDAVVWALMDKALKEPDRHGQTLLTQGIQRMFSASLDGKSFPQLWHEIYSKNAQGELFL